LKEKYRRQIYKPNYKSSDGSGSSDGNLDFSAFSRKETGLVPPSPMYTLQVFGFGPLLAKPRTRSDRNLVCEVI
jgi:hypothetical protein